jgi:hypothetical protein
MVVNDLPSAHLRMLLTLTLAGSLLPGAQITPERPPARPGEARVSGQRTAE